MKLDEWENNNLANNTNENIIEKNCIKGESESEQSWLDLGWAFAAVDGEVHIDLGDLESPPRLTTLFFLVKKS